MERGGEEREARGGGQRTGGGAQWWLRHGWGPCFAFGTEHGLMGFRECVIDCGSYGGLGTAEPWRL